MLHPGTITLCTHRVNAAPFRNRIAEKPFDQGYIGILRSTPVLEFSVVRRPTMAKLFSIVAVLILLTAALFLVSGCRTDPQESGVPAGVTVTIPEGL